MGDEVRRTQQGNNNAYCQDNEISWFDWSLAEKHRDLFRFVKQMIALRLRFGRGRSDADTLPALLQKVRPEFGGVTPGVLDSGPNSHALAMLRNSTSGDAQLYLMVNAYWEPLMFTLPPAPAAAPDGWRLWLDTGQPTPDDIYGWENAPHVEAPSYLVGPRSIVALVAMVQA